MRFYPYARHRARSRRLPNLLLSGALALTTACNLPILSEFTENEDEKAIPDSVLLAAVLNSAVGSGKNTTSVPFSVIDSNNAAFDCNASFYTATNNSTNTPFDLRFFLSEVKLVDLAGNTQTVTLPADGSFQAYGAALLDFENASGQCANSLKGQTSATRTTLNLEAPVGTWAGIEFTLGLPTALNQIDNTAGDTTSPFNNSAMYWSWSLGYKFIKMEWNDNGGNKVNFHLGSQSCSTDASGTLTSCAKPYRSTIRITHNEGFDPASDTIVFNLNDMLQSFPANNGGTKVCMVGDADTDCQQLLTNLGLESSAGSSTGTQSVFSIQKGR